jgi:hypothetical protein
MLDLQEKIGGAQAATADLRRELTETATKEYFAALSVTRDPGPRDFDAARSRAHAVLKQGLLTAASLGAIAGRDDLDTADTAHLTLSFETIAHPPQIPRLLAVPETKGATSALAAVGGTIAGMLLLAPLLRLTLDMRDLGLTVGAPVGALLAVLLAHRLARIRLLTRILPWAFTRPKPFQGNVRSEYEKTVRGAVDQWLEWSTALLAALCFHHSGSKKSQTDQDKAFRRLARVIYALHQAAPESLTVVADELIQEARNSGFEGLEGPPAFTGGGAEVETLVWKKSLASKYETFGQVAEGQRVKVEKPAVVFDGRVVQRGLVRKVRDRT